MSSRAKLTDVRQPRTSRCSGPMELRSKISRSLRLYSSEREPDPHFVDQLRVEAWFNQAPISGQVPPNHVTEGGQQTEDRAIEAEGDWVLGICAHERGGERDEGDAHEEENVQPHQGAVHA